MPSPTTDSPFPVTRTQIMLHPANLPYPCPVVTYLYHCPSLASSHAHLPACTLAPATGVPQAYYKTFAEWMARRGNVILTVDLPFVGQSFPAHVNTAKEEECLEALKEAGEKVNMSRDWVAALDEAVVHLSNHPAVQVKGGEQRPLVHIGHSNGGHLIVLTPRASTLLTRVLYVCAFNPFHDYYPDPQLRRDMSSFLESKTKELGYYPSKLIGLGNNLTSGCGREWNGWCEHQSYFAQVYRKEARGWRVPLLSVWFTDDVIGSLQMLDQTLIDLPSNNAHRVIFDPSSYDWESVGHMTAFAKTIDRTGLWRMCFTDWIERGEVPKEGDRRDFPPVESSPMKEREAKL